MLTLYYKRDILMWHLKEVQNNIIGSINTGKTKYG